MSLYKIHIHPIQFNCSQYFNMESTRKDEEDESECGAQGVTEKERVEPKVDRDLLLKHKMQMRELLIKKFIDPALESSFKINTAARMNYIKHYDEEAAILFDDDLAEVNMDIIRLFPKTLPHSTKLLKTCLIHDENTKAGISPMQVNLIDLEFVPSLLDGDHFEGTGQFVLHYELLLLCKTLTEKCAIVSQIINAALEDTLNRKRRVVIYIPRLERFWASFDSSLEPSIKPFIEEKLMQVSTKPILIISTTCWGEESLPQDLKFFKGPASAQHTIKLPAPEKIHTLLQRILPDHEIFKIKDDQSEGVVKMLKLITEYELPRICASAVAAASGKTASAILTLYYALEMRCHLQGSDWDSEEHLHTSTYFLLQYLTTAIGGL